ncbi:MAG TPA: malto-oligosyltrehalose synthase [Actinocrinis sp.]|nr:malto-oligosyltrehalose synthase [Actinocrinis sp.]
MPPEQPTGATRTFPIVPTSTYRLQMSADFTFDDAAAQVEYLHRLGVSHAYLSPILQAAPGSAHGYDVIDHGRISAELGGEAGLRRLVDALHARGMGMIVDVVPNHMGMPVPETGNQALWSVLRDGPDSPYAAWFDIDWTAQEGSVLLPVLGQRIGQCVQAGELRVDETGDSPVLRYFDHVFPLRPGTEHLPLAELLDAQHYRLAHWRVAAEEPGYRRFFDITTLIAVRMEDPAVFEATHRLLLDLVADGSLDGLRIDHPDGLADPRGYLRRLAETTGGCWTVVEKILTSPDVLPADWPCAGTTGYDALRAITSLLVDPAGAQQLVALYHGLTGQNAEFGEIAWQAKLDVVDQVLQAELDRLTGLLTKICHDSLELRDHTTAGLHEALRILLALCPVYRAYTVPGEPAPDLSVALLTAAAEQACAILPAERRDTVMLVRDLALGLVGPRDQVRDEFQTRFQQTCGPVLAKGIEDTAFYRWPALPTATEVGGDPAEPALSTAGFHRYCSVVQNSHPTAMTALSTHDTKRSEDMRARLAVLAELPQEWAAAVAGWQAAPGLTAPELALPAGPDGWGAQTGPGGSNGHQSDGTRPDSAVEYLAWETVVGCWPIDVERLTEYLVKAVREAKLETSWTSPSKEYEAAVERFAAAVLADPQVLAGVEAFVDRIAPFAEVNTLSQKLIQLTMVGVPDVYQGTEAQFLALVDPDNRRPADFAALSALLDLADDDAASASPASVVDAPASAPAAGSSAELAFAKMRLVSRTLRLRREHPTWFSADATQSPLLAMGRASDHVVAYLRGEHVAVVATRLPVGLAHTGGWRDTALSLPDGKWRCQLTGNSYESVERGGSVLLAELLRFSPVALLVREDQP